MKWAVRGGGGGCGRMTISMNCWGDVIDVNALVKGRWEGGNKIIQDFKI